MTNVLYVIGFVWIVWMAITGLQSTESSNIEATLQEAVVHFRDQDFQEAVALVDEVVRERPDSTVAWLIGSCSHMALEQVDHAALHLQLALEGGANLQGSCAARTMLPLFLTVERVEFDEIDGVRPPPFRMLVARLDQTDERGRALHDGFAEAMSARRWAEAMELAVCMNVEQNLFRLARVQWNLALRAFEMSGEPACLEQS